MNDHTPSKAEDSGLIDCVLKYNEHLSVESERGVAIVGAALIEDALENIIKACLIPSSANEDELFDVPYAPLNSFSAKIDFACRLGLIHSNVRSSLHIIRKIRNDFAHSSLRINFSSQSVRNRVRELFKLNKSLLDFIWTAVRDDENPDMHSIINGYNAKHGVNYLVKFMGWQSTFILLVAIIASSLHVRQKHVETLKPYNKKT